MTSTSQRTRQNGRLKSLPISNVQAPKAAMQECTPAATFPCSLWKMARALCDLCATTAESQESLRNSTVGSQTLTTRDWTVWTAFWRMRFDCTRAVAILTDFYEYVAGTNGEKAVMEVKLGTGQSMYLACTWSHWTE